MALAIGGNQINKAYLGTTEVQKMYLGSELVFDNSVQPVLLTPVMSNFRIENAYPDRVYFDVVGSISGMTTAGFVISGKNILSVDTVNNYFTVSVAFTFWDNNTIRLGENSDTFDGVQVNPMLDNFTLSYIINYIEEPTATVNRYVAVGGTGDGTSEVNAASLSTMETDAIAGQTWWIKAGNYGTETITIKGGNDTNPIKYIGYQTTIGDITTNYLQTYSDINNNWSDTEMPTLVGNDSGSSITLGGSYIIIRNMQSRNHTKTMVSSGAHSNILIERFNQKDNSIDLNYSGFSLTSSGMNRVRIKDNQCLDMRASGLLIQSSGGGHHLIENCGAYTSGMQQEYYISTSGSNSIIRKNVVSMPSEQSSKHGIGIKATGSLIDNNWNLIELNEAYGMAESYYVRNNRTYYNVIKDNYAEGANQVSARQSGGIYFWGGSRYNIVERNLVKNMGSKFIQLQDNDETPSHDEVGAFNIVRNNIFDTSERRLLYSSSDVTSAFNDNQFYNNTFLNVGESFYDWNLQGVVVTDLSWKNNIFDNVPNPNIPITGMTFDKNTFINCGTWADPFIDADNVDIDPQLDANYLPSNESLTVPKLPQVQYDYNSKERAETTTIGGVTLASEQAGEQPVDVDYYVSLNGDNTDGLTPETAYQSIDLLLANETLSPGDVVGLNGGDEFYGGSTINLVNGALDNHIIFTSYGTGKAILKGTKDITGWSSLGDNKYSVSTGVDVAYQVLKDGAAIANGRYPKVTDINGRGDNYEIVTTETNSTTFICEALQSANGFTYDITGAEIYILDKEWILEQRQVVSFNNTTGEVVISSATTTGILAEKEFFFNNNINLLTDEGDWHYIGNTLTMYSASTPTDIEIATANVNGIFVDDSNYITFDNIDVIGFNGYGIYTTYSNRITTQNCDLKYNYSGGVYAEKVGKVIDQYIVDNCIIKGGDRGVRTLLDNFTATNNTIESIGVFDTMSYVAYTDSRGIYMRDGGATITNNTIINCGYNGIVYNNDSLVEKNYIVDPCVFKHDGGGIYCWNDDLLNPGAENSIVEKNTIIINGDVKQWYVHSIYVDDKIHDVSVLNNNIYGGQSNIYLHNTNNILVTGNKCYQIPFTATDYKYNLRMREDARILSGEMNNNTIEYNQFFTNQPNNAFQGIWWMRTDFESYYTMGSFDFNIYYNPGNLTSIKPHDLSGAENFTLDQWQVDSNEDLSSTTTTLWTGGEQSQFVYNETNTDKTIPLTGTWYDLTDNAYVDEITLQPYTSEILVSVTDNLITNGNFEDGDTKWTAVAPWSIGGGYASCNATVSEWSQLSQNVTLTPGSTIRVTFTVLNFGSGGVRPILRGGVSVDGSTVDDNGTYSQDLIVDAAGNTTFAMQSSSNGTFVGSVDNISVKEVI